jgi:TatA/E family protein of Tat protein translocase
MFELSLPHILLLLAIALVVIGPKKLPDIAKTLGKMFGEFQRAADDLKREIKTASDIKPGNDPEQKPAEEKIPEPAAGPEKDAASSDTKTPPEKSS